MDTFAPRQSVRAGTEERGGIWRWSAVYAMPVPVEYRVTLGEGNTPLVSVPRLAEHIGVGALLLKRDDLSPTGSHKARSLAWRVAYAAAEGESWVLLSSSGNAAVAASHYCAASGTRLLAFVSPRTAAVKLRGLSRPGTIVVRTPKPRNLARYASRVFGVSNLTPSFDELSVEGFKSIACELRDQSHDVTDFFTFVTSGSSFTGIWRATQFFGWGAALHAVGAGAGGTLAGAADPRFGEKPLPPSELAGMLGVDESPRAEEVREGMSLTGGRGWVQTDAEILEAHAMLRGHGIDTSGEGAACVSAVVRAVREGALDVTSHVVVLLTGHASQWPLDAQASMAGDDPGLIDVESYVELRRALEARGLQAKV